MYCAPTLNDMFTKQLRKGLKVYEGGITERQFSMFKNQRLMEVKVNKCKKQINLTCQKRSTAQTHVFHIIPLL